jgi:hypothetical protein
MKRPVLLERTNYRLKDVEESGVKINVKFKNFGQKIGRKRPIDT